MPTRIAALALLFAFSSGARAEWAVVLDGKPLRKLEGEPFLSLDLGCGAKLILPKAPPAPGEKGFSYVFHFDGVRENPAYLRHVRAHLSDQVLLEGPPDEEPDAFRRGALRYSNTKGQSLDWRRLHETLDRLKLDEASKAQARAAIEQADPPESMRAFRRALAGLAAKSRSRGPVVVTAPVQRKVLLQQALRSTFFWDAHNAVERERPGADADRKARLDAAGRLLGAALNPLLDAELALETAVDRFPLFLIPESQCSLSP